jgi:hypothetical protein
MPYHQADPADDPAVATLADVVSVAAAMMRCAAFPSPRPAVRLFLGSDATFIRQRSNQHGGADGDGPNNGSRSGHLPRQAAEQQNVMAGSWL